MGNIHGWIDRKKAQLQNREKNAKSVLSDAGSSPDNMEFVDKKVGMTDLVSLSKSIPIVTVDNEKTLTDFLYDDGGY